MMRCTSKYMHKHVVCVQDPRKTKMRKVLQTLRPDLLSQEASYTFSEFKQQARKNQGMHGGWGEYNPLPTVPSDVFGLDALIPRMVGLNEPRDGVNKLMFFNHSHMDRSKRVEAILALMHANNLYALSASLIRTTSIMTCELWPKCSKSQPLGRKQSCCSCLRWKEYLTTFGERDHSVVYVYGFSFFFILIIL